MQLQESETPSLRVDKGKAMSISHISCMYFRELLIYRIVPRFPMTR
jgi:hypothetical protein